MREGLSAAIRILVPRAVVHRQPLLLFVVAAVIGIVTDSVVGGSALLWGGLTVAAILLFAILRRRESGDSLATLSVLLIVIPLAALWHLVQRQIYDSASIQRCVATDPQPVIVDGTVDRPVVLRRHPMADQSWRRDQSPWQTMVEIQLHRMPQRSRLASGEWPRTGGC